MFRTKAFVIFLFVLGAMTCLVFLASGTSGSTQYPPNNGYDTLCQAADTMLPLPQEYFLNEEELDLPILKKSLEENSHVFRLLDDAAKQEHVVRCDRSSYDTMTDDVGKMRAPLRLLQVKAEVAEREGRIDDAVDAYLLMNRLGDISAKGGLLIHVMVANASETVSLEQLMRLSPQLDDAQKRRIKIAIQQNFTPDLDDILRRERDFSRHQHGILISSFFTLTKMQRAEIEPKFAETTGKTQSSRQRLIAELDK